MIDPRCTKGTVGGLSPLVDMRELRKNFGDGFLCGYY